MSVLFTSLRNALSDPQVTTNESVRELHSKDESYHQAVKPEIVVYPHTAQDMSHVVKIANDFQRPVYPFGSGTSLEGLVIPQMNGITVNFSEMNHIIDIRENDLLATVQPGVTRTQLNKALKKYGLFFPIDPGADATIGGMAATNASGTTSVRYGTMRDQVRNLEVVLADGSIIRTGSDATKSSSGYHLNGLFVGSEGTLGCFTELTLRVYGIPEHIVAGRATFSSTDDAVSAVVSILQAGIPVARVELVDEDSIQKVNAYSDSTYPVEPTLFLEFHGNKAGLDHDITFMKEIVSNHGCKHITFEHDTANRNKLWEARHSLAYAFMHSNPGKKMMITDVCVPISRLSQAISLARQAVDASSLEGGIAGHVGDGNYHIILMFDPANEAEIQAATSINEAVVEFALSVGGTCTGEHGVGTGKQKYQQKEHGEALILMQKLKQAIDPESRFNPNKLVQVPLL